MLTIARMAGMVTRLRMLRIIMMLKRLQPLQLLSGLGSRTSKLCASCGRASGAEVLNEWDHHQEASSAVVDIIMTTYSTHGTYSNNPHPSIGSHARMLLPGALRAAQSIVLSAWPIAAAAAAVQPHVACYSILSLSWPAKLTQSRTLCAPPASGTG